MTRRLSAYFTLALHREWSEHADDYRTLEAKLVDADTPFARATALERAWLRNTAYLQRLMAAWRPDTGLVCSPPIGGAPLGFWAELECAFDAGERVGVVDSDAVREPRAE